MPARKAPEPDLADTSRAALIALLLDALDESRRGQVPWSAYAGIAADRVEPAAQLHTISPSVYVHLHASPETPAMLLQQLRRRHQAQVVRQLQVRADLGEVADLLSDLGVPWATVKGPVLAEYVWGRADLRQYSDLDVVIDRRQFRDVLDALLSSGATMIDQNWRLIEEQVRGEVSLNLRRGTMLDLHWHLVNDRGVRRHFPFPIADMLARTRHVRVGDLKVPTFDAADTLLHVAYHTAHSGAHRLLWLKDVERAAADPMLDWSTVDERAATCGLRDLLAVVLERTRRVIGFETPPPPSASRSSRGAWGTLAAAADRWRPPPGLPRARYSGQILFKSVRSSLPASLAAAVRMARDRAGRLDEGPDNPLHVATGENTARESYLATISAAGAP
jgi:hypothetical protein